eukprot:10217019-Lingulodinium_polyedra.AAC.1
MRERAISGPLQRRGRFDRIIAKRLQNAAQRRGRIDRPRPQRLANRTLAHSIRAPENWRTRGARE